VAGRKKLEGMEREKMNEVNMKKEEFLNQKKVFFQKNSEKMGWLKRFLARIAKGTAESGRGKTSCPT